MKFTADIKRVVLWLTCQEFNVKVRNGIYQADNLVEIKIIFIKLLVMLFDSKISGHEGRKSRNDTHKITITIIRLTEEPVNNGHIVITSQRS